MRGNQLGKEGSSPLIRARKLYPLCKPKRAGKQELLPALNTETRQNITGVRCHRELGRDLGILEGDWQEHRQQDQFR